jgi:hypothetical protein
MAKNWVTCFHQVWVALTFQKHFLPCFNSTSKGIHYKRTYHNIQLLIINIQSPTYLHWCFPIIFFFAIACIGSIASLHQNILPLGLVKKIPLLFKLATSEPLSSSSSRFSDISSINAKYSLHFISNKGCPQPCPKPSTIFFLYELT